MLFFFFFNDTATTEIYTLSLHDALPIYLPQPIMRPAPFWAEGPSPATLHRPSTVKRSEEHTSELQSLRHLVCRLLLEKKKTVAGLEIELMLSLFAGETLIQAQRRIGDWL